MVGYLSNYLAPVRVSPFVRGFLIAKFQKIKISTAFGSIGIDRLIDGFVFVFISVFTVYLISFPVEQDRIQYSVLFGTLLSLTCFLLLILSINWIKKKLRKDEVPFLFAIRHLTEKWKNRIISFTKVFVESFILDGNKFNIIIIIFIAILMKFIAASHFFWVGLSYDVSLNIWYYLFLMVFLGYLIILVGVIRITGGFTAGIIFVLQNFGISTEKALAMTLTLFMISKVSVIVFGICSAITMGLSIKSMKKIATKNMSM